MDDYLKRKLDSLSIDELKEVRFYLNYKINSWNSQIPIKDICYDYELKTFLLSMGITNMEELKNNGVRGLPESLIEKAYFLLTRFDFDRLERKYEEKNRNRIR